MLVLLVRCSQLVGWSGRCCRCLCPGLLLLESARATAKKVGMREAVGSLAFQSVASIIRSEVRFQMPDLGGLCTLYSSVLALLSGYVSFFLTRLAVHVSQM